MELFIGSDPEPRTLLRHEFKARTTSPATELPSLGTSGGRWPASCLKRVSCRLLREVPGGSRWEIILKFLIIVTRVISPGGLSRTLVLNPKP